MTDQAGIRLYELISPLVALNLSEAETDTYPYAAYDISTVPVRTKDGIARFDSDVSMHILSKSFDEAHSVCDQITDALEESMRNDTFSATWRASTPSCTEGIWTITLEITIKQYKEYTVN